MQFKKMIEEMSSILWGLSLAFNIILILVGLPLCLLICCCCRKHQGAFEKDLRIIARNHNILGEEHVSEVQEQPLIQAPQKRRVKLVQNKPVQQPQQQSTPLQEPDLTESYQPSMYEMEDE